MIREDISAGHRRLTGIDNACGSEHELSTFLLTTAEVAGHIGQLLSADDDWSAGHNVNYWVGPRSMPMWLPASDAALPAAELLAGE
ncbi:hypothetical protein E3T40_08020 [Cryobacterium sp. TMT1-19]|uniref:hypothetical protein n=1 Tax=unclassified Cryobacterium TaxID=2649013 RepID=UPI00106A614C|nr:MULTISPECIES: hypothetical protein [unclassified Cryobacterium]TFD35678.1 hypothetical protein E3T40_08020 [Cryobacterium sp. TMT1-19]